MTQTSTCTAFAGDRRVAAGAPVEVALVLKRWPDDAMVLVFDDRTGRQIDFDLRGGDEDIARRLAPTEALNETASAPRGPGRPKLGVVAREVTLLPRHWDWLQMQPGGASVALRRLVEAARTGEGAGKRAARDAQEAADRFMLAMAGNLAHYEDATRALWAGDAESFLRLTEDWPVDVRDHTRKLAGPAFAQQG